MNNNVSAFDFRRKPFSLRFDSEFFWTNPRFDIIYNHLLNGIHEHQGVMALTGEAGTGKTFLLRELMQTAGADGRSDIRFVFCNYFSNLDFDDLLNLVCEELDLKPQGSSRLYKLKALSEHLNSSAKKGISTALMIDEAHNLDEEVVSHLATLSRSGFKDGRSLQIVLSGLPLLGEKLSYWKTLHPIMADVSENRLEPLTAAEVASFIRHQLQIAGGPNKELFPEPVLESIARHARVPRLINMFCDRALLIAQDTDQTRISPAIIDEIADDILLSEPNNHKPLKSVIDSLTAVKAADKTDQTTVTVSLEKFDEGAAAEIQSLVQPPEPLPAADSVVLANQRPPRRRGRAWPALLLVISVAAAGGYTLKQRYGFDQIAEQTQQALGVINTQWSSLSSKIMSFAQTPKSEPTQPAPAPEVTQDSPPPPDAGGVTETVIADVQPAVSPSEPRIDMPPTVQPEPTAGLSAAADIASIAEPPVQFDEISATARQMLDIIDNQWSSLTSRILVKAQALKPDTHLPPATPAIVEEPPAQQPEATAISTAVTAQADSVEPGANITPESPPETAAEFADMASVVEVPLKDPAEANKSSVSPEVLSYYMRKGDELFELDDLASARLYYEAAVNAGHTAAMIPVGKTYDPLILNALAMRGVYADPVKAAEWYRKALQSGVPEAAERLEQLQRWLATSPSLDEAERITLQQLLRPY